MSKAIKNTNGISAGLVASALCGLMMSIASASASEMQTITVVPADEDGVYKVAIVNEAATYRPASDTSFRRIQPTSASAMVATARVRAPSQPRIAWPYTARTIQPK